MSKEIWTHEYCKQYALQFKTKEELKRANSTCYTKIHKKKWYDCFDHMPKDTQEKWTTLEQCKAEALKYNSYVELGRNSRSCREAIEKHHWQDECFAHMEYYHKQMKTQRGIYAYEFSDGYAYIGLTCCFDRRSIEHKNDLRSPIYKHIVETNLTPTYKILSDYVPYKEAQKLEGEFVEQYKKNGWVVMNVAKTGGLGGSVYKNFSKKKAIELARGLTTDEFRKQYPDVYSYCMRKKITDEVYKVCTNYNGSWGRNKSKWTDETIIQDALKYENYIQWRTKSKSYHIAQKRHILDKVKNAFNSRL